MQTASTDLIELEKKFWQAMVDDDTDTALSMLDEPSLLVSPHGAMQFDHHQFRQMAEQGSMVIKSFDLNDMNVVFPTDQTAIVTYRVKQATARRGESEVVEQEMADSSVWMQKDGQWRCVIHTETPLDAQAH